MNGWELDDPVGLLGQGNHAAIREFAASYQMAATNPEATALVLIRKYDTRGDCEPGAFQGGAQGLGKGFRVGLCVFTREGQDVFQLPTLRTYLSLSLLGEPLSQDDKIVVETDLGEALTSLAELRDRLPTMAQGELAENALEEALVSIE